MRLNNFSSYFEIFAILNFAYAGFESFAIYTLTMLRGRLIDESIFEDVRKAIAEQPDPVEGSSTSPQKSSVYSQELIRLEEKYDSYLELVKKSDKEFEDLSYIFTPSFLVGGLFCLCILLLGSFEQLWVESNANFTHHFMAFLDISILYISIIHLPKIFSFGLIETYSHFRLVTPFFFLALLCILASIFAGWSFPYDQINNAELIVFFLTILTGCFPFLVSIPRIVRRLRDFNKQTKPLIERVEEKLIALQKLTKKDIEDDLNKTFP